ncbi:MAG: GWxTD domain-containing protein [Rhodothermales bacterium]
MKRSSIIPFILAVILGACSTPAYVPTADEGGSTRFDSEAPHFDVDVMATINEGSSGIDVYVSVPHSSLSFTSVDSAFTASYELLTRVRPSGGTGNVHSDSWSDTVRVFDYGSTVGSSTRNHHKRIPLPAGSYLVETVLETASGGARAVRRIIVDVFSPGEPALSDIQLRARREGGPFEPELSFHVRAGYDSLRVLTELYSIGDEAEASLSLVRLVSDTLAASPPFWFTPGPFSLSYLGIDYEYGDTIQVTRRRVRNAAEEVAIEFTLPDLERGNYVALVTVEGGSQPLSARRYFSVRRTEFPYIASLREMVESLVYIAREDELREILSAATSAEMKARFDAFWAARVPNREAAASILQSYYSRVEEANLLFSNHKEGWKTDEGMVFIVFGAPAYTETHHIRKYWYYFESGFPVSQRLEPFVFRKSTAYGFAGLFENYVLQRSENFELQWRRRVDRWRDGTVL